MSADPRHPFPSLFDPVEEARLARQTKAVWEVMRDGQWRTLAGIKQALADSGVVAGEPSISARLRQLRGVGHQVDRKQEKPGLFVYRVWPR